MFSPVIISLFLWKINTVKFYLTDEEEYFTDENTWLLWKFMKTFQFKWNISIKKHKLILMFIQVFELILNVIQGFNLAVRLQFRIKI